MSPSPRQYLWFERALLPKGWARGVRIGHAGGFIVSVEKGADAGGCERHGVAVPGLANLHSHAFQRAMAGLAEVRGPADDDFWTWREVMYRFLAALGPDEVRAIAAMAYCEMLESGFTRVGEFHYLHHDPDGAPYADPAEMARSIVAATQETGIALTLLPVFYAHGDFGGAAPTSGQRRFVTDLDGFAGLLGACRTAMAPVANGVVGIAPHSLRAVTPEELANLLSFAEGGPIHIHAAEQVGEVAACLAWCGARPVEWLLGEAGAGPGWCLVHATHLTADETADLAASGAVAGLCPITEANLGDGLFPAHAYFEAGGAFGVGTDSNVYIDAAAELRGLEYGQRLALKARNLLAAAEGDSVGRTLFDAAISGGALALGAPPPRLAVGSPADIVDLDLDHASLHNRHGDAVLDSWIFAAGGSAVRSVWRAGRKVVADGRHVARPRLLGAYREAMSRLER